MIEMLKQTNKFDQARQMIQLLTQVQTYRKSWPKIKTKLSQKKPDGRMFQDQYVPTLPPFFDSNPCGFIGSPKIIDFGYRCSGFQVHKG